MALLLTGHQASSGTLARVRTVIEELLTVFRHRLPRSGKCCVFFLGGLLFDNLVLKLFNLALVALHGLFCVFSARLILRCFMFASRLFLCNPVRFVSNAIRVICTRLKALNSLISFTLFLNRFRSHCIFFVILWIALV